MEKINIMQARREDIPALASLKYAYVRNLYRGFLPLEVLEAISPEMYRQQFEQWMDTQHYQVETAWQNGELQAFVVFGESRDQPGSGLIYESGCKPCFCMENKSCLMEHALEHMREMGFSTVYQWILRDNFRVRVVFESMGFRPDGVRRSVQQNDQELLLTRYIYNL